MMRVRFPFVAKLLALVVFLLVTVLVGTQLVKRLNPSRFEQGTKTQLQGKLAAVFDQFKYVHHEGGRNRYTLTAARNEAFEDGHHELKEVKLEVYDEVGAPTGQVTAELCHYNQAEALLRFNHNVRIESNDGLKVKTESLTYNQQTERAETEDQVEFERDNVIGSCRGMLLDSPAQYIEMRSAVDVTINPPPDSEPEVTSNNKNEKADKSSKKEKRKKVINTDNKQKVAKEQTATVSATTATDTTEPIKITGGWGEYTSKDRIIKLRKDAQVATPTRSLAANAITVFLNPTKQIERVEARGKSRLESKRSDLLAHVAAQDIDFFFDQTGNMTHARAVGNAQAEALDQVPARNLKAERLELITVVGESGNEISEIKASGNVYLNLPAAVDSTVANPTHKELRADEAELFYYPGGKFLRQAEARKQVLLTLTPKNPHAELAKRSLQADRCELNFFETDNAARDFLAQGKVKVEETPYAKEALPRITESDQAEATFERISGNVVKIVQEGNFKYTEGTKHALATRAVYTMTDSRIELRGEKVMVWDETARTQADEIDIWTAKQESVARGRVRSTYYNAGTTGQTTPFRNMKSPVFITAKEAHSFQTRGEVIYNGDARAWQEENFVRADRLELYRDGRRMLAQGNVSSALYQTTRGNDESTKSPVFATSDTLDYKDEQRLANYSGNVKMRQREETLEATEVKIFLKPKVNEVERMEALERVVLVQPGRRAEGDKAEYIAAEQRTVITGNVARVVSVAQGMVTGRRLTLLEGDDKILADDQRSTKRVRSTHEVQR